jgi:hypothetical protein
MARMQIKRIFGAAAMVAGCCALVFAGLLAWVEWGGSPGGWFSSEEFPRILWIVGLAMAISALIGLGAILLIPCPCG